MSDPASVWNFCLKTFLYVAFSEDVPGDTDLSYSPLVFFKFDYYNKF